MLCAINIQQHTARFFFRQKLDDSEMENLHFSPVEKLQAIPACLIVINVATFVVFAIGKASAVTNRKNQRP